MFAFLGLLDDLLGDALDRGLRGHVAAALRGRVTTGFVKLGGGAAVAQVLAATFDGDRPLSVHVDGALLARAATKGAMLAHAAVRQLTRGVLADLPLPDMHDKRPHDGGTCKN